MKISKGRIRTVREAIPLSQAEFAVRLGVSLRTVTRWECGETSMVRPSHIRDFLRMESEKNNQQPS